MPRRHLTVNRMAGRKAFFSGAAEMRSVSRPLARPTWFISTIRTDRHSNDGIDPHAIPMTFSARLLPLFAKAVVVLALSSPLVLTLLVLERSPTTASHPPLQPAERAAAERLLIDSAPARMDIPSQRQVQLEAEDLALLLRYFNELLRLDDPAGVAVGLEADRLQINGSLPLHGAGVPAWLNLNATLVRRETGFDVERVRLGQLGIPGPWLRRGLNELTQHYLPDHPAVNDGLELLRSVAVTHIDPTALHLTLNWDPERLASLADHSLAVLIPTADRQRIINHQRLLAALLEAMPEETRAIPLHTLLVPLMAAAQQVSRNGGDAVAENRTLLITLASYVNGDDLAPWVGADLAPLLPELRVIEVRVHRRQDLARHVAASAAIAAWAGAGVAGVVSTAKEAYDARYRSGYSFSDLAGNAAGMTLGRLATDSDDSARTLQSRIPQVTEDGDFVPEMGHNRDGLSDAEFVALAQNNPEEYQRQLADIESRVAALPLFAGL